jgi:hypothetical protein
MWRISFSFGFSNFLFSIYTSLVSSLLFLLALGVFPFLEISTFRNFCFIFPFVLALSFV